jgi:toxin ParE1/3/4
MPTRVLKAYRLTPAAQADLAAIWTYSAEAWSVSQADAYVSGLKNALDVLLDIPELARERAEITPPVRVHRHRSRPGNVAGVGVASG